MVSLRVRDQIDDGEFEDRRRELLLSRASVKERLAELNGPDSRFEPAEELISFGKLAADWFHEGNDEAKRLILKAVSSNLSLSDKKLSIEAAFPFHLYAENPYVS